MFKTGVTHIFFDLDHTLWDFEKNSELTFAHILPKNGIETSLDGFMKKYRPINFAYWKEYRENKITKAALRYNRLRHTFDAIGIQVSDEIINKLSDEYIGYLSSFGNLLPQAKEILEYLDPKYNLHIITNGFQEIQDKKLKNSGIMGFFDVVVNSEMAGVKKPHPQIFELALQMASAVPSNSVMIGDNLEADIQGAYELGLKTIHLKGSEEPHHDFGKIINTLGEIKNLL
ncbi:MAG: YjjG family noncanonical pyrimidine nucleotidase [Bacteroidota bacterium]